MIENLQGITETVNFRTDTSFRLYVNDECENYPSHWHRPLEIIMPIENNYKVVCHNTEYILQEDDILLIGPGIIHELYAPPVGKRLIFQASLSIIMNIKELASLLSILPSPLLIPKQNMPGIHPRIQQLLLQIIDDYQNENSYLESLIYSRILEMFSLLGQNKAIFHNMDTANYTKQKEYTDKFIAICEYITTNCTKDLKLEDVAKMAGFSKYHFSRLFKEFTSVSFYKFVNTKRIITAENMLINPDISVTEVATSSGFNTLSSFIRMFRIIKGCTPTEFRNMHCLC